MPLNKERGSRMKRLICILLAAMTALSLTACQKTPEKVTVVKKDTERMIEQASSEDNGNKLSELDIPDEHYAFNSELADGRLKINVDADIRIPEADTIPIRKVSMGVFSQEAVTVIFNYLFEGEQAFDISQTRMTKADYEKRILGYRQTLADKSYLENDQTEQEILDLIAIAEEEYEKAPESLSEPSVSNGTMVKGQNIKSPSLSSASLLVQTEDGNKSLTIFTPSSASKEDLKNNSSENMNMLRYRVLNSPAYTTKGMQRTDGTSLPEETANKLTISFDEAQALCDGLFSAAGMQEDFCVGAAFLIDDKGTGLVDGKWENGQYIEGSKEAAENYAYQFYYTREADSIPLAVYTTNGGAGNPEFSIPWGYEYICFTVDNSGIVSIIWTNPIIIGEVVQEDAIMKPFDEIITIFENMVKVTYQSMIDTLYAGEGSIEINVDDVELCLLRVREQNGDETAGLLIPAWVFYGHSIGTDQTGYKSYDLTSYGGASRWPEAPITLLAINAVDGTIIDLSKGY